MFKHYRMDGLTEREKAERRRRLKLKSRFSIDKPVSDKPKEPNYLCPTNITQTISRKKRRGFNGCKMSAEVRALVAQRREANAAFHRELRASLRGEK